MEVPASLRQLMESDSSVKEFIEMLINKIEKLEKKLGDMQKEKLPFYKPNNNKSHKKPGQKQGHEGISRTIPSEVHEEIELKTDHCPRCSNELNEPVGCYTRYVEDIEPARPRNKKYTVYRYWCVNCRKLVNRKIPDAIPNSRFGIKLMLWVAFQRHAINLPFSKIRYELESYFGINATEASLYNGIRRLAKIFGNEYQKIKALMKLIRYVHFDDTGWRINGKNEYLWDFINDVASFYVIANTRGGRIPKEILGKDYDGIAISDFYPSFDNLPFKQQKCWLHILRKTRDNSNPEVKRVHRRLKRLLRDVKVVDKERLLQRLDEIISVRYRTRICRKVAKLLRKHRDSMFRFVDKGIDCHNNDAERGLRNMVIMRKVTGGSKSWSGAEALAVNKTIIETWKKQGKDFFEYGEKYIKDQLGLIT